MKIPRLTPQDAQLREITRRHFFRQAGFGIGASALASLLNESLCAAPSAATAAANPLAPKPPMFPAKAKNIIYLFMAGAPSQLDLLDFKPKLQELNGQHIPESMLKGERFAFIRGVPKILGSPYQFQK